jgi:hypothetical protein
MTEELGQLEGEPTDNAIDVIEAVRVSSPNAVFRLNVRRIRELLEAAWSGIEDKRRKVSNIVEKLTNISTGEEQIREPESVAPDERMMSIKLTEPQVEFLREVMSTEEKFVQNLHFHLHNILCVAIWGALEGYIQAALAAIFTSNPDLMTSEKKISVTDAIHARDYLIDYLVAKELDDIGRMSFDRCQEYLKSRLHLQFSNEHTEKMRGAYFLRNVIAHSAGFLRKIATVEEAVLDFDQRIHANFRHATVHEDAPSAVLVKET